MMANILVIDDDISICKMMAFSLKRKHHVIDYALSLEEGLKHLSGHYDIIFLDVNLPDGNGLEVLPALRHPTRPLKSL
ncbi:MAG: response regulator [Desulfobacterales bacterium]